MLFSISLLAEKLVVVQFTYEKINRVYNYSWRSIYLFFSDI